MWRELLQRVNSVCNSGFKACLIRAAFAVAFYGALCVSKLVSLSKSTHGGLLVGEVFCRSDLVALFLRWSKTDQQGKGRYVQLHHIHGSSICPMAALEEYCSIWPMGGGSFLVHRDGSALSNFQFVSVFRQCLVAAGFDPIGYSSHSFHIGAAHEAAWWGLDNSVIKRIGLWESDRVKLYIRPHYYVMQC